MSVAESDIREQLRQALQQPSRTDQVRAELKEVLGQPKGGGIARTPAETSGFGTFLSRIVKGTGNAILASPDAAGDMMAMVEAGLKGTVGGLVPGGRGFEYGARYDEARPLWPQLPRYTVSELNAAARAGMAAVPGGVSPEDQYGFSMENSEELRRTQSEEHPFHAAAGDFGGDIAALLLTKQPVQGTIRRTEEFLTRRPDMYFGSATGAAVTPGVGRVLERTLNSNLARYGARGGFRAAETGLEAAYLEAISAAEGDPLLAAGLAAGGQVGGSLAIETLKGAKNLIPGKPLLSLGVSALSTAGLWQMLKSATPGGRDRILESVETGYDKITYTVMLGALGALTGGRARDAKLYEDLLPVSEAFMTVPRGVVLSLLSDMVGAPEEDQARFESTLEQMMQTPDFEGRDDFERAIVQRLRGGLDDGDTGRGPRRGVIDRSRSAPGNADE